MYIGFRAQILERGTRHRPSGGVLPTVDVLVVQPSTVKEACIPNP
jgi:hypothetical protein